MVLPQLVGFVQGQDHDARCDEAHRPHLGASSTALTVIARSEATRQSTPGASGDKAGLLPSARNEGGMVLHQLVGFVQGLHHHARSEQPHRTHLCATSTALTVIARSEATRQSTPGASGDKAGLL